MKVRGVFGPDDTDDKEITLLSRIVRYGNVQAEYPISGGRLTRATLKSPRNYFNCDEQRDARS